MTEAKINKLQLQRQVHIEQMERAKRFVTECGAKASYPELELRLISLDKTFESICGTQSALEAIDSTESEKETRADFEELYFLVKPALQVHMCRLQKEERTPVDTKNNDYKHNTSVRLPKIEIKPFSGDYTKWLEFHEAFDTLVHRNEALNDVSRFQYLRNSLTNSASRVIESLELTSQNYHEAIKLLTERFSNKKLICSEHIKAIFSLKPIVKPSHAQLRELIDCINAHLRSLTSLGRPTQQWDDLIVHIIYTKLDPDTRAKWDDESPAARLSTLEELFKFLNRRCQNLEGSSIFMETTHAQSRTSSQAIRRPTTQTQSSFVTSSKFKCSYCLRPNHMIYRCRKFLNFKIEDRNREIIRLSLCSNCLKPDHTVHSCPSTSLCYKCNAKHHTFLHIDNAHHAQPDSEIANNASDVKDTQNVKQSPNSVALNTTFETSDSSTAIGDNNNSYVYLATAVVKVLNKNGTAIMGRALLDSASQLSFITQSFGAQLGLKYERSTTSVCGIGSSMVACNLQTFVTIQSRINSFSTQLEVHVLPKIIDNQPSMRMNLSSWKIPTNIQLADPHFAAPQKVDMLIGAQLFFNLLSVGQIKLSDDLPILQNTLLGWVIAGRSTIKAQQTYTCNIATDDNTEEQNADKLIKRFWELETSETSCTTLTPEEERCEQHFNNTVTRDSEGRFVVALPLLRSPSVLGNSRSMAEKRFFSLEGRLNKNHGLKQQYIQFLDEYKTLGHMRAINEGSIAENHFYMPHHCVLKPESTSTKLRVVFDASAKGTSGISLNDILMVGPVVQQDLLSILLRFRTHSIVFSADIVKMYRQIWVTENDAHLQYIVWRNTPNDQLTTFQLQTVTYGTAAAPYLATKCLQRLAMDETTNYPRASEVILRDVYVDDVLTGANSLEDAIRIKSQTIDMLSTAGMELKKWCSNHPDLLSDIPAESRERLHSLDDCDTIKTLGLFWQPQSDHFRFNVKLIDNTNRITKRTVLADIARIFDPLGLTGPVIVLAKIFMQQLWLLKQNWDSALPQILHTKWNKFRTTLQLLNNLRIDRHIFSEETIKSIQLHGYADASEKAYGCAIYVRSINFKDVITVKLLCAKSKVAPLKTITLPRLELCAAQLLAQTMRRVEPSLNLSIEKKCYWTDSKIVLSWLEGHPSQWKTFVANRVAKIQSVTSKDEWYHVDSKNNAADIISRGVMPEEFGNSSIWFNGPKYLLLPECSWNVNQSWYESNSPERKLQKCVLTTLVDDSEDILQRIKFKNNFISLRNVMSYILRYLHNSRRRNRDNRKGGHLSQDELNCGLQQIIKIVQRTEFPNELVMLRSKGPRWTKNHLASLSIFLDDEGIIRVGGRLQLSTIPYCSKHPILLPFKHFYTLTLLNHFHIKYLHAGPQALLAAVRQDFWPLKGRRLVQRVFRSCIRCFKTRPTSIQQIMGNLPAERIRCSPPFANAGVDYCGPVYVHYKIRGKAPTKAYICLFICFAVKAVHLELVTELTTAAFIGALKRFVATRGLCSNLFSDNGTNFVGANSELHELFKLFSSQKHNDDIIRMCQADGITWHFAPPAAPHFGGLYEAAVKSAKFHMRRVVANSSLTFEELNTVIKQIEAVLNSRPLTPSSSSPDDLTAITPGHFLIGRPLTAIVEPNIQDEIIPTLKRWRLVQQIHQHFWSRWSKEYLVELQHRKKWTSQERNIAVGELVMLKEENLPPLKWRLGRIVTVHRGQDGNVRVVTIRTAQGQIKRAISKICPFPTGADDNE